MNENIRIEGQRDIQTKVMTTLFALFAEVVRDLISERTREGLAQARASVGKLRRSQFQDGALCHLASESVKASDSRTAGSSSDASLQGSKKRDTPERVSCRTLEPRMRAMTSHLGEWRLRSERCGRTLIL